MPLGNILNLKMASKSMILSNCVTKQLLKEHRLYNLPINGKNIKNSAHEFTRNLTHSFKKISTRILFCRVEVIFAIQDGRHRKLEFNITLN